jgi:hypothetical protein
MVCSIGELSWRHLADARARAGRDATKYAAAARNAAGRREMRAARVFTRLYSR